MNGLLIAAALSCPLWSDLRDLAPGIHWEELNPRAALGAQVMYSMAPGTPTELPEAAKVYLGTKDGEANLAVLYFVRKDLQVCVPPMKVEKDGLKILHDLQSGPGDDL